MNKYHIQVFHLFLLIFVSSSCENKTNNQETNKINSELNKLFLVKNINLAPWEVVNDNDLIFEHEITHYERRNRSIEFYITKFDYHPSIESGIKNGVITYEFYKHMRDSLKTKFSPTIKLYFNDEVSQKFEFDKLVYELEKHSFKVSTHDNVNDNMNVIESFADFQLSKNSKYPKINIYRGEKENFPLILSYSFIAENESHND